MYWDVDELAKMLLQGSIPLDKFGKPICCGTCEWNELINPNRVYCREWNREWVSTPEHDVRKDACSKWAEFWD